MEMLVLCNNFCIFSRNTRLPNFVNIFIEKYSSYFYKQDVIWKVIQLKKKSLASFSI